ncbi:MAG: mannose-6-phosphate isomerase, class I [Deltaproteobacteria bacterium]|nr:mannose-6-phosphate isomerase, class I [Deltaproteobacteria bacterium]
MEDNPRSRAAAIDSGSMSPRAAPFVLAPGIQTYAWGDPAFIPKLFGRPVTGEPHAEAWFGAHPALPSLVDFGERAVALDQLLAEAPERVLGKEVAARFSGLPFLFKILAAAHPLSVQAHPSAAQAAAGFERENKAGIALRAAHRHYRDANAKPELLVALTPFQALCGFRPLEDIAAGLALVPELAALLSGWQRAQNPLRSLLTAYSDLPDEQVLAALGQWLRRLRAASPAPGSVEAWVLQADRLFAVDGRPDRGLFFFLLLNHIVLEPGQGLFLSAGTPHAYLHGAAIEVMASSDNVLRAGLTQKHVDARELTSILRFESQRPPVLQAVPAGPGHALYLTSADAFELHRIDVGGAPTGERVARGPELVFFLADGDGAALEVELPSGTLNLGQAGCCLLPHESRYRLRASGPGRVMRVSVPMPSVPSRFRGRAVRSLAFGTSGLRGLVSDITDLEAYVNTRGFLAYLRSIGDLPPGGAVALAGDLRPSTDSPERSILRAVARAVADAGCRVVHCGRLPTPAVTAFGLHKGWPSIMVTGSHIPFDRNGIKFNKSQGEILKDDEPPILRAIALARQAEHERPSADAPFGDDGMFRAPAPSLPPVAAEARQLYLRRYVDFFPPAALAGLRVGVYEHSTVGSPLLVEILRALGAEVFPFGSSMEFVAIDTENISETRLRELQVLVDDVRSRAGVLDAVVSMDGDSDRPMLLGGGEDGRLRFFPGDVLGIVVADYLGADALAVPVTATDAVELHFAGQEVRVVRTRVGSPYVIAAAAQLGGRRRVGWEANGGFMTFSPIERQGRRISSLPTRDAILPMLAALHTARERGVRLGEVFAALPPRHTAAGLIDGVLPDESRALTAAMMPADPDIVAVVFAAEGPRLVHAGDNFIEPLPEARDGLTGLRAWLGSHLGAGQGFGAIARIEFIDGVRILFDNHDVVHIRPSGNAPQLRAYALADSEARAQAIVALAIREPDGVLRALLGEAAARAAPR